MIGSIAASGGMLTLWNTISTGVTDAVKTALGIHDAPSHDDVKSKDTKASAKHPTSYDAKQVEDGMRSVGISIAGASSAAAASDSRDGSKSSDGDAQSRTTTKSPTDPTYRSAPGTEGADTSLSPDARPAPGTVGDSSQTPPSADGSTQGPTYADVNSGSQAGNADAATGSNSLSRTSDAGLAAGLVRVYDSSKVDSAGRATLIGSAAQIDSGSATAPANAQWAAQNVSKALQWYSDEFGRNGLDGKGLGVDVVLNDNSSDASGKQLFRGNGGFYTTSNGNGSTSEAMRFGAGTSYAASGGGEVKQYEMEVADDLAVHELTHGVIKHETGAIGGGKTESGSVNEGLADIMAASATKDWVIGEGLFTPDSARNKMRNIADPNDPKAVHTLWSTMDEYRQHAANGTVEEHYASGILSQAAYRIQQNIGGDAGYAAVARITYDTITGGQLGGMSFEETANAMRAAATRDYGAGSSNANAVDTSLRQAGL